jgi:hypothetical protein
MGTERPNHADRVSNIHGVTLLDDEELLFDLRPAWYGKMSLKRLTVWVIITIFTGGLALLYYWYPIMKMRRSSKKIRYVITSERIIVKDEGGMFGTASTEEYPLRDLSDIQTTATWFEQRAGVGTVKFREYDGATSDVALTSVRDHEEVASTIGGYQRRESKRSRHYGERR